MDSVSDSIQKFLDENRQDKLPFDPSKLRAPRQKLLYLPYGKAESVVSAFGADRARRGQALRCGDTYYILYDDALSPQERDRVIFHETLHVVLGHVDSLSDDPRAARKQDEEMHRLIRELLAPAALLVREGITTPGEIHRATGLSRADSLRVAYELRTHNRRAVKTRTLVLLFMGIAVFTYWRFTDAPDQAPIDYEPSRIEEHALPSQSLTPTTGAPTPLLVIAPEADEHNYYWTQGGTVYHPDPECTALKRAKYPVQSGTLDEAKVYKKRICELCKDK